MSNKKDSIINSFDVNKNRIFILGAGFSAAADIPLMDRLLKLTMEKFKEESPLFERVDNYTREFMELENGEEVDYSKVDFSKLCTYLEYIELREYGGGERASEYGSREKESLKYYLSKTIAEHTPSLHNLPQIYIDFVKQLHVHDIILTFNWDLLLEIALTKVGKSYTYTFEKENIIRISKLHGSINWQLYKQFRTLPSESLKYAEGIMENELYASHELLDYNIWDNGLAKHHPFLVLPGFGKAFDVRFNALNWYKIESALAFSKDIYIIGLSLADDDFFIKSFFVNTLTSLHSFSSLLDNKENRKIFIITPDKNVFKNYSFLLKKKYTKLCNEKFSNKHIVLMKNRLTFKENMKFNSSSYIFNFFNILLKKPFNFLRKKRC